ncbi:MAG: hypothetical protein JJE21_09405 [Spirochaetaceae bacterium]|nr:hypothetical protein [Spirochaetaceae bacterium]
MAKSYNSRQGKEFARYALVTEKLESIQFYFPSTHALVERETNENTNGVLREYISKIANINSYPDDEVANDVMTLNIREKKCLCYKSPFKVYYGTSLHLT